MSALKKRKLTAVDGPAQPMSPRDAMEGELKSYPAGTRLVTENELSRKMFIIKTGKVRVYKSYMGQKITLAVLGEGEVFGELSFFDAAPRSASVDSLTDVEVIVIDGKQATDQIRGLPSWVVPIFKTVFHRFREADQKITVLQSMNEFQKKVLRSDGVAKSIYLELLRFIRTLELLYSRGEKINGHVKREALYKELDEVLGKRVIGLAVFWKVLKENDFIDAPLEERSGEVALNLDTLTNWKEALGREVETERFLLLSHSAVAILRRLVSAIFEGTQADPTEDAPVRIPVETLKLEKLPLAIEAMLELSKAKIIRQEDTHVVVRPSELMEVFNYQSLLKSFDHTIVNLE